jgi:hypothetical protein
MSIIIQSEFDSAVLEANKDVYVRTYIGDKKTIIEFDMRKGNYQKKFGIKSEIFWSGNIYHVDIHEFSTFHNPIVHRFVTAQGYYFDENGRRIFFTPEPSDVSTCCHMSLNVLRPSCFLTIICGVSLRNIANIFSVLFKIPITKSSIKRWIDEIGRNLPSEEEILKKLAEIKMPEECHIDGYYPLGTNNCVMVTKDESDRILITHETDSENAQEAEKFLRKLKDAGINITSAFSDYSKSFMKAIKTVFPNAKFQADHFHTVKTVWGHLKKALSVYRKDLKAIGRETDDKELSETASKLWELRWSLLKKPSNLSEEERKEIEKPEKTDTGFITGFRSVIRQIVNISDHSNTEIQAGIKLKNLKNRIEPIGNNYLNRITKFFDEHWQEAMQFLRKRGLAKHRRSSDSESGMRILRRLEKNHDGIRSEAARKNYIKIYQTIKYLSGDVADFLNHNTESDIY